MSARFEWVYAWEARVGRVWTEDERAEVEEAGCDPLPEGAGAVTLDGDDCVVIVGTPAELTSFARRILKAAEAIEVRAASGVTG